MAARAQVDIRTLHGVPAYLGLAGIVNPGTAARVAAALPFETVLVEEDRPAALTGALGEAPGCVVSVGTGSFLGRRTAAGVRFIGGHGLVLGDEASGAWLGCRALARSQHALDGIIADSPFCAALRLQNGGRAGVIAFARNAAPHQFAAIAPEIVAAAGQGDAMACDLMSEGADYIVRGLHALGWSGDEKLCLLGGLGRDYVPWLPPAVQAAIVPPLGTALDGALTLAGRLARARQG
jgi:glucosamine kinase